MGTWYEGIVPILCLPKISMKGFRYGERGFTLLEVLLIILILSILAGVVTANLSTFVTIGKVAAANTEVGNVETAALAYYADNDKNWPDDAAALVTGEYLNAAPQANYGFDRWGTVIPEDATQWGGDDSVVWNATDHKWEPASE